MDNKKDMDRKAFGRKINAIRREKNISSEKLSELCDVNAVFIRQIESATRLPSLPVFLRICNSLKVSPNAFLADSLIWNEEDKIENLAKTLRGLSPRQFNVVMDTTNTLIKQLAAEENENVKK